jgi:very-short-patch-repair endonuclease
VIRRAGEADAAAIAGVHLRAWRVAASVWELLPFPAHALEVTTLRQSASMPTIRVHRSRTLDPEQDVVEHDGLPVTSVARTLLDLADVLSPHGLGRVCHRAEILRLDLGALRRPNGRRTGSLDRALATLANAEPQLTRSALEERFLSLLAASDLPLPRTNVQVHGLEVDALWSEQRLVAELDGAATHLTPGAFEDDRRRDAQLQAQGYRVVRFTWRRLVDDPGGVVDTLLALFAAT